MKTGKTLIELATEIERQAASRVDYIAPTQHLVMRDDAVLGGLLGDGQGNTPLNALAHRQLGDWAKVPAAYYDRLQAEAPALLATNINHWLAGSQDKRMVRTLDGNVRAWLSDSYRPLENHDLAEAVLPALLGMDLEIISSEITERRLYIKAVDKRINRDIPTGKTAWATGAMSYSTRSRRRS